MHLCLCLQQYTHVCLFTCHLGDHYSTSVGHKCQLWLQQIVPDESWHRVHYWGDGTETIHTYCQILNRPIGDNIMKIKTSCQDLIKWKTFIIMENENLWSRLHHRKSIYLCWKGHFIGWSPWDKPMPHTASRQFPEGVRIIYLSDSTKCISLLLNTNCDHC